MALAVCGSNPRRLLFNNTKSSALVTMLQPFLYYITLGLSTLKGYTATENREPFLKRKKGTYWEKNKEIFMKNTHFLSC